MSEAVLFLGPALVMCIFIASIHVYLGLHILEREVIFVDLSLAQLAALGTIVFTLLGHHQEDIWPHAGAFGFTILGAAIFALAGRARQHVSQEAVVGIVYAVASALMILVLSRAPHGAEQMKNALVGSLLVSSWRQAWVVGGAYLLLGTAHMFLARRFIRLSWEPDIAEQTIPHVAWWDFGFYVLFGIVITISVQVAGVLLVFSYLIVPAVITKIFSENVTTRLLAGWGVAVIASVAGLWGKPRGSSSLLDRTIS